MKKILLIMTFTLIATLGFAASCFAWGPGVHMAIGNALLANPDVLPAAVARLLLTNSAIFLYGCLSADIFIGKGSKAKRKHSHNWKTGFALLNEATEPHLEAYSLGYLSHLAADIIAHNYYVPNLMHQAPAGGRLSHVYIEMLADDQANWSAQQATKIFRQANGEADLNLRKHMDAKKLSFFLKKSVFHQTIGLLEYKTVTRSLNFSKKVIPAYQNDYLHSALDYSYRVVVDMLQDPNNAVALNFDPIGSKNIGIATYENSWRNALKRPTPFSLSFKIDPQIIELPQKNGVSLLFKTPQKRSSYASSL
ncbi:zinc dependent phospholipase C family protein [Maridesulfovibrio zosterae]|uniref:zinc dependent phospholipase C family protein n=1 Tax=Maridesulfovibrio zosterae TaxID=82171 RepID=UPI000416789F|nr:zinc dependent phospholipase C family protein [Maridesulfovibrio zosterae]